jgi:hypothetical protein
VKLIPILRLHLSGWAAHFIDERGWTVPVGREGPSRMDYDSDPDADPPSSK